MDINRLPLFMARYQSMLLVVFSLMVAFSPPLSRADIRAGDTLNIKGYLKNESAWHLSHPRETTKIKNIFQVEVKYTIHPRLELYGLGRCYWDSEGKFEKKREFESWELYGDFFAEDFDLRLGRQQVVWGEADGLRINDIINPQDFKEFILPDYIDSRIPLWMAKLDFYLGDVTIEGLIIPDFKRNRFARHGSEWEFYQEPVPRWLSLERKKNKKPAKAFKNWEWGLRIFRMIGGWDLSCSYFYTWDDFPAFHASISGTRPFFLPKLILSPRHHRLHVFGFTYNKPIGPFVLRGEGSYYLHKYFRTADTTDNDAVARYNYLYYMLGCDYHVRSNLDLNFQFIQKVISNYSRHLMEREVQNSFTLFLQSDFIHETLKCNLLFIYNATEGDMWINPEASYDVTDTWQVKLGMDFFEGGTKKDFFGQFDKNDRIYLEIKYGF